jgi:hypothetical protein
VKGYHAPDVQSRIGFDLHAMRRDVSQKAKARSAAIFDYSDAKNRCLPCTTSTIEMTVTAEQD